MQKNISYNLYHIMELVESHDQKKRFDLELIRPYLDKHIQIRVVPKNGYIAREDVRIKKVIYIMTGTYYTMRTSDEGKVNIMAKRSAPQLIGVDRALNQEALGMSSNLALEICLVLEIDQGYFIECIRANGELGLKIIQNLCDKLINASLRSDRLLFNDSREHLMFYIYRYWNESHQGEVTCKIAVKHPFIADDIGISTRTLYRALNDLKKEGLIHVNNGVISVTYQQIQEIRKRCSQIEA